MKITENELIGLLTDEDAPTVELLSADGAKVQIYTELNLILSKDMTSHTIERAGYNLVCGTRERSIKSLEKLLSKLKELGVLTDDGAELSIINDECKTLEEYEWHKSYENIGMAELLEMYGDRADTFALVCPYNDGYDKEHPFGCVKLSDENAKEAFDTIRAEQLKTAREQYDGLSKEEKDSLPPFEELLAGIESEHEEYVREHMDEFEENGGYVFFADKFMRGETKYVKPGKLWHIYHIVDFIGSAKYALDKMQQNSDVRPTDSILRQKGYEVLLENLERTEVTFTWHCTTSSMLSTVFYFKLNEKTKGWLMQFKDDYDIAKSGLADLAFYKGDTLLFSSCTHEGFHNDCSENLKK